MILNKIKTFLKQNKKKISYSFFFIIFAFLSSDNTFAVETTPTD
jgi:hypothetical protein